MDAVICAMGLRRRRRRRRGGVRNVPRACPYSPPRPRSSHSKFLSVISPRSEWGRKGKSIQHTSYSFLSCDDDDDDESSKRSNFKPSNVSKLG
mmetsp:Transcript_20389/g.43189  ORF Transcript_20389/g.43189 Transcript_20389/m.43189 type:complete len:93 (+) Transcript_20389:409-687(+)